MSNKRSKSSTPSTPAEIQKGGEDEDSAWTLPEALLLKVLQSPDGLQLRSGVTVVSTHHLRQKETALKAALDAVREDLEAARSDKKAALDAVREDLEAARSDKKAALNAARSDLKAARSDLEAARSDKKDHLETARICIAHLQTNLARAELKVMQFRSKSEAILNMCQVIECGTRLWSPHSDDSTSTLVSAFVKERLLTEDGKLTAESKKRLKKLKISKADHKSVEKELHNLNRSLNKTRFNVHPPAGPHQARTGFVCGGSFPLSAAAALHLLELQTTGLIEFDIAYVKEGYGQHDVLLSLGTVWPVRGEDDV